MKNLIRLYRFPEAVIDAPAATVIPDAAKPADLAPASAATTLDINTPAPKVETATFVLPDAYKDKTYLKGVKDLDQVYKMLDGAQELIGKKGPALPKPEAPQAEWDAYYESIGRPKTAAEYAFDGADKANPAFLPKVQAAMHKAGLTPSQAKTIWSEVNVALGEFATEKGIADKQADIDFDKLAADTFGVDRDKVLARGKELVYSHISPTMKDAYAKLDNNSLVVLADVLRNIDSKYIKADGPGKQPDANGVTPAELSAKARTLMVEQGKYSPMSQEFLNIQKQIDDCYNMMRRGTR